MREELLALVEQGIFVPLSSQWSSPVVPAPKKDGDFLRINKVTKLDPYYILLVQSIINKVGQAK